MTSFSKLRNAQRRIVTNKNTDPEIRKTLYSQLIGQCRPCKQEGKKTQAVARIKEWALCEVHKLEAEKIIEEMDALRAKKEKQ